MSPKKKKTDQSRRLSLLFTDESKTEEVVSASLRSKGYDVILGVSGLQQLLRKPNRKPDVIVVDSDFKEPGAVELLKSLRKNEQFQIALSVILGSDEAVKQRFEDLKCDYFAAKPVKRDEIQSIAECLQRHVVLVMGEFQDFKDTIKSAFSENRFKLQWVDGMGEMFVELGKSPFTMTIVRLAQIDSSPQAFMARIHEESENPNVLIFVYSDANAIEVTGEDMMPLVKIEVAWLKAGRVVFYDARLKGPSIKGFLEDDAQLPV